jgi:hypothetical protein
MREFFFLMIVILGFNCQSQEVKGSWKVISYEDEIAYFNKITDSISYKDSLRKNEADNFKKMSELLIFPITYAFDDKGNFTMNFPMMDTIKGKYQLDKFNNKLILIDEEGKKDELNYLFKNELLFIVMKMESGYIKLGFKRN